MIGVTPSRMFVGSVLSTGRLLYPVLFGSGLRLGGKVSGPLPGPRAGAFTPLGRVTCGLPRPDGMGGRAAGFRSFSLSCLARAIPFGVYGNFLLPT